MKHEKPHNLNVACLECIKVHLEHKEKLIEFLRSIMDNLQHKDFIHAEDLLQKIEADND